MGSKSNKSRLSRNETISKNSSDQLTQGMSIEMRLKAASDLETQLVNSKDKPADELSKHRTQLCSHLCEIILGDPSCSMKKDCIHRLWRGCFYPQIASLRGRFSKEKSRRKRSGGSNETIKNIEKSLTSFLNDATQLYSYLTSRYEAKLNEIETDGVVQNLHKLLIHLGDLHRYSNESTKAESCYMKASIIAPGRGNPYNQLAVVSQQPHPMGLSRTCVSLYWYARSLLATYESFDTSRSNLARLFDYNKVWLDKNALQDPPLEQDSSNDDYLESWRKYKSAASRHFLAEYVHFHGFLFMSEQDSSNTVSLADSVITKFKKLLQDQTFGEALVLKMIVINAFSCSVPRKQSLLSISFALLFSAVLAEFVCNTLQNIAEQETKKAKTIEDNSDNEKLTASVKMLSPLLLFCDWFNYHQNNFDFGGVKCLEPFNQRARASFWKAVIKLANQLKNHDADSSSLSPESMLKEHEQLKGFSPFAVFIDHNPKSSFFKDNSNDDFGGFLSSRDAINALDRHKLSANTSYRTEVETKIRIQRFFSFIEKSSATSIDELLEQNNKNIVSDHEMHEFLYFDRETKETIRVGTGAISDTTTPKHRMDKSKEDELEDEQIDEVKTKDDHYEDGGDEDDEDLIVYNGIEISNPTVTERENMEENSAPIISYQDEVAMEISDMPAKTMNLANINTKKDDNRQIIESNHKGQLHFENLNHDVVHDEGNGFDHIEEKKKSEDESKLPIPINPPPGFGTLPQGDNGLPNASNNAARLNPFGVTSELQKCFDTVDDKFKSEESMIPPNILDSFPIGSGSIGTHKKIPSPPPGFVRPLAANEDYLFYGKKPENGTFSNNHIGGPSLLFAPTNSLFTPYSLPDKSSDMEVQRNLQTKNPFVSPLIHTEKLVPEHSLAQKPLGFQKEDDLLNAVEKNNGLRLPTSQSSLHEYTWNPFI